MSGEPRITVREEPDYDLCDECDRSFWPSELEDGLCEDCTHDRNVGFAIEDVVFSEGETAE
jgi:hypothetical protein